MARQTVYSDVQLIAGAANLDIQPPAGQVWEVTQVGSSVWVGAAPNERPQVDVGLFDGVLGPSHILRSTDVRGWNRRQRIMINNTHYLRLNNPGGAGANISHSCRLVQEYGVGLSVCMTDIQAIAGAANLTIQPPAGSDYKLHDFGSDVWVGAGVAGLPDIQVNLTDGLLPAIIMQSTDTRQWNAELEILINNATYITITNTGALANISFSGELYRMYGAGQSVVISDLQAVGALGSVDFQPPVGIEWRITGFAGSLWAGVPPNAFPDFTVHLFDGAIASQLVDQVDWKEQGNLTEIMVDRTEYIRITDTSGVGGNVGIIGEMIQRYA